MRTGQRKGDKESVPEVHRDEPRMSLAQALAAIPAVGEDADFARVDDSGDSCDSADFDSGD